MESTRKTINLDHRVNQLLENLNKSIIEWRNGNDHSRHAAIAACTSMVQELEQPGEMIVRRFGMETSQWAVIKTALDLDLYKHVNAGNTPKTAAQLAKTTGADPVLMSRILKVLTSIGIVDEVDSDHFQSTSSSVAFADPDFAQTIDFEMAVAVPAHLKTPEYLRETKYQNPSNPLDTPVSFTHGGRGECSLFDVMDNLGHRQGFDSLMKVWRRDCKHWSDDRAGFYPIQDRLIDGAKTGGKETFLVDIGGGPGNDMLKLLAIHPRDSLPGGLVLQDLAQVINTISPSKLPNHIQKVAYDFFEPQPVKGARVYFMHSIVHDWSDDKAKEILKNIAGAMEPGYSKLVIWDQIVPDKNAPQVAAGLDWLMLVHLAGCERSESSWRALLEDPEVGLKLNGIWHYSQYDQAVIEAELA